MVEIIVTVALGAALIGSALAGLTADSGQKDVYTFGDPDALVERWAAGNTDNGTEDYHG